MKKLALKHALNHSHRTRSLGKNGNSRIKTLIEMLLAYPDLAISPHLRYCFSLLCCDGLPFDQIEVAIQQKIFRTQDGVAISWREESGRNERYILSSVSIEFYSKAIFNEIQKVTEQELQSCYQSIFPRQSLKQDQLEWLSYHLNGPLFEHVSGHIRMAAIPDNAYIRILTKSALVNKQQEETVMQTLALFFESKKVDRNTIFIEQIIHACRRRNGVKNYLSKEAMFRECLNLSKLLDQYGPISALILAWAFSLIKEGTRNVQNLSQAAISNYVSSSAKSIFNVFKKEDIENIDDVGFIERYARVIAQSSDGQKNIVASAISSFHSFLQDWLDVVSINRNQFHKNIETVPRANIIWQHEINNIMSWLEEATCDERLIQFWRLAILLASQERIRVGELFALRLTDIQFFNEIVVVQIVSGKTAAAKRSLSVRDEDTRLALKLIVERRQKELAYATDFIFGDPKSPQDIYHRGQFYLGLNGLLKQVTGDRTISFHTLSHSVISFKLIEPLAGDGQGFHNPLAQLATNFGHFSIMTSCSSYMHLYYLSLRRCMDRALQTVVINSRIAALWSNKTDAALRKQVSKKKLIANSFYWKNILYENTRFHSVTDLPVDVAVVEHTLPDFLKKIPLLSFEKLLFILKDLSENIPISTVISRYSLEQDYAHLILKKLGQVFLTYQITEISVNPSINQILHAAQHLKKLGFDFDRVGQSKHQELLAYLKPLSLPLPEGIVDAIDAWLSLPHYSNYQAINESNETLTLLNFLHQAKVLVNKIAIFIADDDQISRRRVAIRKLFLMTFCIPPAIFIVKARRGRPHCYISMTKEKVMAEVMPYGSANSASGFKAIMLALAVMKVLGEQLYA